MLPFEMTCSNLRRAAVVEVGLGRLADSSCRATFLRRWSCSSASGVTAASGSVTCGNINDRVSGLGLTGGLAESAAASIALCRNDDTGDEAR